MKRAGAMASMGTLLVALSCSPESTPPPAPAAPLERIAPPGESYAFHIPPGVHAPDRSVIPARFGEVTTTVYTTPRGKEAFVFVVTDYPPDYAASRTADQRLDAATEQALGGQAADLVRALPIEVDGYLGRDLEIILPETGHKNRIRAVIAGPRLYQLIVATGADAEWPPELDAFLAGLELGRERD